MYPEAGERWNVNMPAVVGVVFAFLVGVVLWVILSTGGNDRLSEAVPTDPTSTALPPQTTSATVTTLVPNTSPAPMPDLNATTAPPTIPPSPTTTIPPTPPTTSPAPATTAAGATPDAIAGDLAVPGRRMEAPSCDGAFITVVASAVGDEATAPGIARVLAAYPGSNYLRTDQTCPSLTQSINGQPIYVVYLGPFASASDACAARGQGPEGAYPRQLSDDLGADHSVPCA